MNKTIGIALIVLAAILAYLGFTEISNSTASVDLLGVEVSASDEGAQTTGIIYLVVAAVAAFGGFTFIKKS